MAESRRTPRATAKQHGLAVISGRSAIPCTIRDLSATGAKLSFHNPTILPRIFSLQFEDEEHRATVVWQAGVLAGVRFQTPRRHIILKKKRAWPWSRK